MNWGDGLRVNPGVLHARASQLTQVHSRLGSEIQQHESIDLGPWRGQAQRAHHSAHRQLVTALKSHARRIPPVSGALDSAGNAFSQIQGSQRSLIQSAARWQFQITDSGSVQSTATGWARFDPRREAVRRMLQVSVTSVVFRLNFTDISLSAKLKISDAINDALDFGAQAGDALQDFGALVADGALSGLEWTRDKVVEGLEWTRDKIVEGAEWARDKAIEGAEWAKDVAHDVADNVSERVGNAGTALDRLRETAGTTPQWLRDFNEKGEIPQISEVLGAGAYLAGQAAGIPANFLANKDLHFFDDGRPYMAGRDDVHLVNRDTAYNGPQSMVETMKDLYDVAKGQERAQIQLTAVEDEHGVVRYVATVPGTLNGRDGWSGDAAGTDWPANFRGVGYGDTAATQSAMHSIQLAIEQDMAARGLPPDHRPEVVLSGHSQGGIMAGNIANNEAFNERFNVSGVVTAGAPIDTLGVPEHIPVYNYQNTGDVVPMVDLGGAPSGQPGNVTNIPLPYNGGSPMPGASHGVERYGENVGNLQASNGYGGGESQARQSQMNSELGRFYNGTATTYRVTYGRETN